MKIKSLLLIMVIAGISIFGKTKNNVTIGGGIGISNINRFYRANSMVAPIPVINARYDNFFINNFDIGVDIINKDAFTFSLFVNPFDGNRLRSNKMDKGYRSIDNRNTQIAGGVILGYDLNFYNTKALISMSGGKRGTKGDIKLIKPFMVTDRLVLIPGIGGRYYSKDYSNYYWGIDKDEIGGKIKDSYSLDDAYSGSLELATQYYLTEKLTILAFMSVERFSGDVEGSPIIDNNTMMIMGAGIKYSF